METFFIYLLSLVVVFLVNMMIFYLDNKYVGGEFRDVASDLVILYIITLIVPIINIIATIIYLCIFFVYLISEVFSNLKIDGESFIKKIFFIKDDN